MLFDIYRFRLQYYWRELKDAIVRYSHVLLVVGTILSFESIDVWVGPIIGLAIVKQSASVDLATLIGLAIFSSIVLQTQRRFISGGEFRYILLSLPLTKHSLFKVDLLLLLIADLTLWVLLIGAFAFYLFSSDFNQEFFPIGLRLINIATILLIAQLALLYMSYSLGFFAIISGGLFMMLKGLDSHADSPFITLTLANFATLAAVSQSISITKHTHKLFPWSLQFPVWRLLYQLHPIFTLNLEIMTSLYKTSVLLRSLFAILILYLAGLFEPLFENTEFPQLYTVVFISFGYLSFGGMYKIIGAGRLEYGYVTQVLPITRRAQWVSEIISLYSIILAITVLCAFGFEVASHLDMFYKAFLCIYLFALLVGYKIISQFVGKQEFVSNFVFCFTAGVIIIVVRSL